MNIAIALWAIGTLILVLIIGVGLASRIRLDRGMLLLTLWGDPVTDVPPYAEIGVGFTSRIFGRDVARVDGTYFVSFYLLFVEFTFVEA